MKNVRVSSIRLLVDRFDECFHFYHDILGGEVTWGQPGEAYAQFSFGGTTSVALFRRELNAAALGIGEPSAAAQHEDQVSLIMEVDCVDTCHDELKGRISLVAPPTDREAWGIRTIHIRDPDGNLVELNQPLSR